MPTCANCHEEWTWTQTMKTLFRLKCPYCSQKQYETAASRQRSGMIGVVIPLLLLPVIIGFSLSISVAFILAVIVSGIIIAVYPFMLKLSNEEEPFF